MDVNLCEKLKNVRLIALDVDGTLSDGRIVIAGSEELCKCFNCKDGLGISVALRHGIKVIIITGRVSSIVEVRARELKLTEIMQGVNDKAEALIQAAKKYGVTLSQTAFMGDDLNDLAGMMIAGIKACPSDAAKDVLARCDFVAEHAGGRGAVRDLIEAIMKSRGLWEDVVSNYITAGQGDKQ